MAEMLARLVPNAAPTDTNSNIASGLYTAIDSTVDAADGSLVTSVTNAWTGSGTANAFTYALTDLPAAAASVISVRLRARSKLNSATDDENIVKVDITGTNAPTDQITLTSSSTLATVSSGQIATSATPANVNSWLIRVHQSLFTKPTRVEPVYSGIE